MRVRQFGKYQLEALIGTGGMGEVYRAYDTQRHRTVAIKLLPDTPSNNNSYKRRFRRESYLAARLREPHVVPIHDFGELEGRLFIDMRLVDGDSIHTILEKEGSIPSPRTTYIIGQVAEALEAAHSDGLVHRDIKPSNILVTATDFVYVVDFGIAQAMSTDSTVLTVSGTAVGTLDYMAPERFENRNIDKRSDVYSLTCLLHECLTGSHPFSGDDLPSLMYAHIFSPPPQPSRINPAVPESFDPVIARGMAKSPGARFGTALELAEAAKAALAGHSPATSAPSGAEEITDTPGTAPESRSHRSPEPQTSTNPSIEVGDLAEAVAPPSSRDEQATQTAAMADPHDRDPASDLGPLPPPPPPDVAGRTDRNWLPRVPLARASTAAFVAVLVVALVVVVLDRRGDHAAGPAGPTGQAGELSGLALPAASLPRDETPTPVAASVAVPVVDRSIPIGPGTGPGQVAVAPDGRYAYTVNRDTSSLSVIDTTLNTVTATVPITVGPPQFVAFAPDGRRAYLSITNSNRNDDMVAVLDTASNMIVATIPVGIFPYALSVSPDGKSVYVPDHDSDTISVISTATNTVVATIRVPASPHSIKFSRDGRRAYVANHQSNVVSVLDTTKNTISATVAVGLSPHSLAVAPDQSQVADVNYNGNSVSTIATPADVVTATISVGANPQDIAFAPDGQHAYVANNADNNISVIDAKNNRVTATIPAGRGPTSVAVTPDGRHAYVTNLDSADVTVLSTAR